MSKFCLSTALLVLLVTLVAGTQGERIRTSSAGQPPAFCLEPPYTGPCKALFSRFFFNSSSGLCEIFYYGGCKGKQNRFLTEEECVMTCGEGART
ncbi:serum basic protease inhibitor-like [Ctenodactylus gundi]